MTKRHATVEVLDENTLELGVAPDPPDSFELVRNGQTMTLETDYLLGEGDESNFVKRQRGEPWGRADHFSATWFTD